MLPKSLLARAVVWYVRNPAVVSISSGLLRRSGATIGAGSRIKRSLYIDNVLTDESSVGDLSNIRIGENCYVGDNTYMDLADVVELGDNTVISGGVSFVTHSDCNRSPLSEYYPREQGPIRVKDGAWIGFGATISHGVTIGEEAVVGAGAVVRDDVKSRTVVAGIPAEKVDEVGEEEQTTD